MATRNDALKLRKILEKVTVNMNDKEALEVATFVSRWKSGVDYIVDDRVSIEKGDTFLLYKCIQAHTSQDGWTPDASPSLFAKVLIPDPEAIPEWEQPDSTNPYMAGDKVTHNGSTWISLIDNNVWEPTVENNSLWKIVV